MDFYSGFVYDMLGIPKELYTAIFTFARIVGWSAHRRIEELVCMDKIIRPAYKSVMKELNFFIVFLTWFCNCLQGNICPVSYKGYRDTPGHFSDSLCSVEFYAEISALPQERTARFRCS